MSNQEVNLNYINKTILTHANYLKNIRNVDGGWGSEIGNTSSPHNTAEVVTALLAVDDEENIDVSIHFLLNAQCTDGGWPKAMMLRGEREPCGQTIATSWSIQALIKYIRNQEAERDLAAEAQAAIDRAQKFLLNTSRNRKRKGSWTEHPSLRSSVTATCHAVWGLIMSKDSNPVLEDEIIEAVSNSLHWLEKQQNTDGGIGFITLDSSKISTTSLLAITTAYAKKRLQSIPEGLIRSIDWTIAKITSQSESIEILPETEDPDTPYETVLTQYQHHTIARIISLIFTKDIEVNEQLRKKYLNYLLSLQRPAGNGGIPAARQGRIWTWSTAQSILALKSVQDWRQGFTQLNSGEDVRPTKIVLGKEQSSSAQGLGVNILHLSDLHLGNEDDAETWYTQLAQDLKRELHCNKIGVVIVSGDIANKSTPEEYISADLFLEKLCEEFDLTSEQIVIVPGNHDVNWSISKKAYEFVRKEDITISPEPGYFIDRSDICEIRREETYKQRFEHFSHFYKSITGTLYPVEYEQQGIIHRYSSEKLLILSLNSAWNLDYHFTSRASINIKALSKALDEIRSNSIFDSFIKIAVWHHPVSGREAMDDSFLQQLTVNGFKICLHGHIHETTAEFYKYDEYRKLHIISAGTFGAPTHEQVPGIPLQYNLINLSPDNKSITVKTRKKEKLEGAWSADARWGDRNNPASYYTFDL